MEYTSKEVYEYISKQTNDPIVERKTCTVSGTLFPIYKSDLEFYEKVWPVFQWVKYPIATPKLCPEERRRRRMGWRNENSFYRRTCNATGKQVLSMFSEDNPHKVYDWKIWYSDQRDPLNYWIDMDYGKPFFQVFQTLNLSVPKPSLLMAESMENCDYCSYGQYSKSCYLSTGATYSENCYYSSFPIRCVNDIDWFLNVSCQNCYQCICCHNCYETFFCDYTQYCKSSYYLSFCNDCECCIGCTNLNHKKYCILNKQYSKEKYEDVLKQMQEDSAFRNKIIEEFNQLRLESPRKHLEEYMVENNFSNSVQNGKGNVLCFNVVESSGNKYSYFEWWNEDPSYDSYSGFWAYCVESCWTKWINSAFIAHSKPAYDCYYSIYLINCKHCFWCVGLKDKEYCILNKQYTPDTYEQEVVKIIKHMQSTWERWEFFPLSDSLFGYNESVAQTFLPLTADKAKSLHYRWQDNESVANIPQGLNVIPAENLHDHVDGDYNSIVGKAFLCSKTHKPYRFIEQEFNFYKKYKLPLPKYHHDERKKMLLEKGMWDVFDLTTCDKCKKEILYVRNPWEQRKIYCKDCYSKYFW